MVVTPLGIVKSPVKPLQFKKALSPMVVTLLGIVNLPVKVVQPSKALLPIVVTPFGMNNPFPGSVIMLVQPL